jgi:thiol-disulfide isomerase/thioredoxin
MPSLSEVVGKILGPYYKYIIGLIALIIFGYAANYGYKAYYLNTKANKFANAPNANRRNKEVSIMFFHVDWCPHCKSALPDWNNFKKQYNNKEMNGYVIKCTDIDCTKETSEVQTMMSKYNIESYPTVKMSKDNKTIEFESKITLYSLESFVESMVN